jgi:hypothetical protein
MAFQVRNVGTGRLRAFAAEIAATDMRSGNPLTMPPTTIAVSGVEPRQAKELTTADAHGAQGEHARLQVRSVTCTTRCEAVAWTQQGLGAFETAR